MNLASLVPNTAFNFRQVVGERRERGARAGQSEAAWVRRGVPTRRDEEG